VKSSLQFVLVLAAAPTLGLFFPASLVEDRSADSAGLAREHRMTNRAIGTFDVKLAPLPTSDSSEGSPLGRMSIDKQIHGDLEATSKGEMLTAREPP
jgi:Protein of unknown function (DUF3224)